MLDLKESARKWVLSNLPFDRSDTELASMLNRKDAHGLLVVYHNWISRQIKQRPRKVIKSSAFVANEMVKQRSRDFDAIISDIEAGADLMKYLSRDVNVAVGQPIQKGRRRDLDLLLLEWGVHHMHISQNIDPDGFVTRDGPLLFAVFREDAAFLIDVLDHKSFTDDQIVRVMYEEWPDSGLVYRLHGADKLSRSISKADRARLRKNAVNAPVDLGNGVVVKPVGGLTTSGLGIESTLAADRLLDALEEFEDMWENRRAQLNSMFAERGFDCPPSPQFEFAMSSQSAGVIEVKSQTFITLI